MKFAVYIHNCEVTGTFTQSIKMTVLDFRRISLEFSDNTVRDAQNVKKKKKIVSNVLILLCEEKNILLYILVFAPYP